jgi:hypothetical protein
MTLPSFGVPLSLNQIHVEVGGTSGTTVSLNETDVRGLINKTVNTSNSISDYYGASYVPPYTSPIVSGDGFFWWYSISTLGGQPNPQFTFAAIVVKLGGNVVKGSFTASATNGGLNPSAGQSWHNGTNSSSNNLAFLAAASFVHTDGYTYVPVNPVIQGQTSTYPSTNLGGSLPQQQSAYDAVGIKLQGT